MIRYISKAHRNRAIRGREYALTSSLLDQPNHHFPLDQLPHDRIDNETPRPTCITSGLARMILIPNVENLGLLTKACATRSEGFSIDQTEKVEWGFGLLTQHPIYNVWIKSLVQFVGGISMFLLQHYALSFQ